MLAALLAPAPGALPVSATSSLALSLLLGACTSTPAGPTPLDPGCLGVPGATCSLQTEGTQCPGPPTSCIACAPGVYTVAYANCVCTSGLWQCGASTAQPPEEAQCTTASGRFVDPSCTVPASEDASAAGAATDAASGAPVGLGLPGAGPGVAVSD